VVLVAFAVLIFAAWRRFKPAAVLA
jgi:hypothetical protein